MFCRPRECPGVSSSFTTGKVNALTAAERLGRADPRRMGAPRRHADGQRRARAAARRSRCNCTDVPETAGARHRPARRCADISSRRARPPITPGRARARSHHDPPDSARTAPVAAAAAPACRRRRSSRCPAIDPDDDAIPTSSRSSAGRPARCIPRDGRATANRPLRHAPPPTVG